MRGGPELSKWRTHFPKCNLNDNRMYKLSSSLIPSNKRCHKTKRSDEQKMSRLADGKFLLLHFFIMRRYISREK